MIILIDNNGLFTYNLYQTIGEFNQQVCVFKNNKITIGEIAKILPDFIVIASGPGMPVSAGISKELILEFSGKIPILGVSLGHLCIGEAFGAKLTPVIGEINYGSETKVYHKSLDIFKNVPSPFPAARYHSHALSVRSIKPPLEVIAKTKEGTCMAVKHKTFKTFGLQFNPESILTPNGKQIIKNFLDL